MTDDRNLDAILDEALATYTDAEPDPSLRTRIMAHAAEAAPRRTWRVWALSCSAAFVAAAGAVLFLSHPVAHRPSPDASSARMASPAVPAPANAVQPRPALQRVHATASALRAHRHFQAATFRRSRSRFIDDALTEKEQILLKFVTEHPREAREVLKPPPPGPIEVAPLAIPPLEIAALPGSGHNDPNHPEN
jgi:hypothetical protein